jgi:hypothetical protein
MMFLNWECPAISSFLDRSLWSLVLGLRDHVAGSCCWILGRWIARLSCAIARPRQRSQEI